MPHLDEYEGVVRAIASFYNVPNRDEATRLLNNATTLWRIGNLKLAD